MSSLKEVVGTGCFPVGGFRLLWARGRLSDLVPGEEGILVRSRCGAVWRGVCVAGRLPEGYEIWYTYPNVTQWKYIEIKWK